MGKVTNLKGRQGLAAPNSVVQSYNQVNQAETTETIKKRILTQLNAVSRSVFSIGKDLYALRASFGKDTAGYRKMVEEEFALNVRTEERYRQVHINLGKYADILKNQGHRVLYKFAGKSVTQSDIDAFIKLAKMKKVSISEAEKLLASKASKMPEEAQDEDSVTMSAATANQQLQVDKSDVSNAELSDENTDSKKHPVYQFVDELIDLRHRFEAFVSNQDNLDKPFKGNEAEKYSRFREEVEGFEALLEQIKETKLVAIKVFSS